MEKAATKKKKRKASEYRRIEHGFDPVFNEQSRILVLGSFPSVASRENNFYYSNPHNRFWRVLAFSLGESEPASIDEKRDLLLRNRIALWDVIESCDIKGSSDASIKNVVPAHIERIFEAAPICAVLCNGATAARLYRKYLQYKTGIEAIALPSTSPANASWGFERLAQRWNDEIAAALSCSAGPGCSVAVNRGSTLSHNAAVSCHAGPNRNASLNSDGPENPAEYAVVALPQKAGRAPTKPSAPAASSFAVHRSMQGNKRANTKPELLMRARLREAGLGGYRLQWKVPGRPDIAWPGKKVALFVNGCFWHRCPHCQPSTPKKNVDYWLAKFERNVERDTQNLEKLEAEGWKTHVIWECQLKRNSLEATLEKLFPQLKEELGK